MRRERVLIVEDDARLAEVLARELGRGYDTVVVGTGRDALHRAETEPFALVLLDLLLENQGRVFSKETLVDRLYGAADVGSNAIEAVVSRVRKKVEALARGATPTCEAIGVRPTRAT